MKRVPAKLSRKMSLVSTDEMCVVRAITTQITVDTEQAPSQRWSRLSESLQVCNVFRYYLHSMARVHEVFLALSGCMCKESLHATSSIVRESPGHA